MAVEDLIIPKYYENKLDIISTEIAIKYVKDLFERRLAHHLNLMRISAPLYVSKSSGLNDDLNGTERPVAFDIMEIEGEDYQIVHSLAKWKRMALKRYNLNVGKGIYTDMNAIRRDEVLDNLHSCYVDQWDWEKIISRENRTMDFLKMTVRNIMKALKETEKELDIVYENLMPFIQEDVYFLTTQYLEEAEQLADHIAILDQGRILTEGTPAELKKLLPQGIVEFEFPDSNMLETAMAYTADYTTKPVVEEHKLIIYTDGSAEALFKLFQIFSSSDIKIQKFYQKLPNLEDVFLNLIHERDDVR